MPNSTFSPRATGTLTVVVRTASGALPVPDAQVTIRSGEGEEALFLRTVTTDESGRTPTLILEAPSREDSLSPGGAHPYAVYDIQTVKDGFYTGQNLSVPLFAGVHSVQPVELIPQPPYESDAIAPTQDTDFTSGQSLNQQQEG